MASSLEKSEKYVKINEKVHYRVLCAFVHNGCSFHGFAKDLNFEGTTTIKNIIFGKGKFINKNALAKIDDIIKPSKRED